MSEQLTSNSLSISFTALNRDEVDFELDRDGDLMLGITDRGDGVYTYIQKADVAKLRDWLNEVVT